MIKMIKMIKMILDLLARDMLHRGSGEGVEWMTSWIWEVSARAMGMVFAYGLGDCAKCSSLVFRIHPAFFSIFRFQGGPGI